MILRGRRKSLMDAGYDLVILILNGQEKKFLLRVNIVRHLCQLLLQNMGHVNVIIRWKHMYMGNTSAPVSSYTLLFISHANICTGSPFMAVSETLQIHYRTLIFGGGVIKQPITLHRLWWATDTIFDWTISSDYCRRLFRNSLVMTYNLSEYGRA